MRRRGFGKVPTQKNAGVQARADQWSQTNRCNIPRGKLMKPLVGLSCFQHDPAALFYRRSARQHQIRVEVGQTCNQSTLPTGDSLESVTKPPRQYGDVWVPNTVMSNRWSLIVWRKMMYLGKGNPNVMASNRGNAKYQQLDSKRQAVLTATNYGS